MGAAIDNLAIRGFRSIRALENFSLGRLNILVGANGAGKSNFVAFFRMLRAMADQALVNFVTAAGGADGFFFNGPKETPQINARLVFGNSEYGFDLEATASNELMVSDEWTRYRPHGRRHSHGGGRLESALKTWEKPPIARAPSKSVEAHVDDSVSSWIVYHFHDTSALAPMRREQSVHDRAQLNPDASNIAALLHYLKESGVHTARYERIRETVQLVAPFFDDFLLEPTKRGNEDLIRL